MEHKQGTINMHRVARRPVPNHTPLDSDSDASLPPLPPRPRLLPNPLASHPLRLSRSATSLHGSQRQNQHQHQHQLPSSSSPSSSTDDFRAPGLQTQSSLPVGFVVSGPSSPLLGPGPDPAIRRVKSSSALGAVQSREDQGGRGDDDGGDEAAAKPAKEGGASKWKTALGEAQYFAGGLISHPAESTRHYSIIRHSHALIWYRGPSTSVTISVLSGEPLPPNRTLWLQQKGYSGHVGMSLKALTGPTRSWLDVTPQRQVGPETLAEAEERGIQRDLKRFAKKASGRQKKHAPRETHVVRIPAASTDGYFRLVLCAGEDGKKVLCGSPVFRVASTSTDSGVVRGAGLSSMPLEVGVKVASTIGQTVATKYTGVAQAVVQSKASKLVTSAAVRSAGSLAYQGYQMSGAEDSVRARLERVQEGRFDPLIEGVGGVVVVGVDGPIAIIGADAGPEPPFPLKFDGKVVKGTGRSTTELRIPTANLSGVPEHVKARTKGVFAAWACVKPKPKPAKKGEQQQQQQQQDDVSTEWHEALVTIGPLRHAAPEVAAKTKVTVHIIHDFEGQRFPEAKVKVLLMAYLRPPPPPTAAAAQLMDDHARDVLTTLASLGRENWQASVTAARLKEARGERSFSQKVDEATGKVHQQVDRLPLHWAGVRSEVGAMQDKGYGQGGIWVAR